MNSGRRGLLRHTVSLQRRGTERDANGEIRQDVWVTLANVRASVSPVSGREYIEQMSSQARVSHRVRIRYFDGLSPKDRILFEGRTLDIAEVLIPNEVHRMMDVMCEERLP